jgi:hypothetical protein
MALGTLSGSNLYFACRSSYNSTTDTRRVREYFCPPCADPMRGPSMEL